MKYKVGDKVRVKRTLSAASSYGGVLVNTDMAKRGGEIATITKIYDGGYNISGDYWFWSDEMVSCFCGCIDHWPAPGKPCLPALPHPTRPPLGPPSGAFPSSITWVE